MFLVMGITGKWAAQRQNIEAVNVGGPRSRGYGARSGYDVRTRCIRGCTEGRDGVSPERIRHETETARFCVGAGSA
jgi:hypothetical protein